MRKKKKPTCKICGSSLVWGRKKVCERCKLIGKSI